MCIGVIDVERMLEYVHVELISETSEVTWPSYMQSSWDWLQSTARENALAMLQKFGVADARKGS